MNEPTERSIASLRRLARGLVYESHGAEDLVQEAWLAALERREELREPESWFARVLRNLSLRDRRSAGRRAAREQEAARPEAQPSSAELAGRTEVLRRLLDAVDALEDPYRTAIHLRYLEDLPPRAIARRLGVPVNTARTHVRRGLEQLRRKLDGGPGREREALLAVLAPIVGKGAGLGSGSLAEEVVERARASVRGAGTPAKLAGAVALVAGAASLVAWLVLREESSDPGRGEATAAGVVAREVDEARVLPEPRSSTGAQAPLAPESSDRSALTAAWSVRGCVTRARGESVPGAALVGRVLRGPGLEGPVLFEERFAADANGEFVWSPPLGELATVFVGSDVPGHLSGRTWDTVAPGDASAQGWNVDAYPLAREVTGIVRAPGGAPLAGARVIHRWHEEFRTATTDASGRFALAHTSFNQILRVVAEGYGTKTLETPRDLAGPYDIELEPERRIPGIVSDEEGHPISGVEITQHTLPGSIRTDAAGRFVLGGLASEEVDLSLHHPDFRPILMSFDPKRAEGELRYTLSRGVPLSGRVLDAEGEPVVGAGSPSIRTTPSRAARPGPTRRDASRCGWTRASIRCGSGARASRTCAPTSSFPVRVCPRSSCACNRATSSPEGCSPPTALPCHSSRWMPGTCPTPRTASPGSPRRRTPPARSGWTASRSTACA
jgi:RNA polymerase sigma factor (sigma-70 family)